MTTYNRILWTAALGDTLTAARLVVQSDWATDPSDYWTVSLQRKKPGDSLGVLIAPEFSLATWALSTNVPVDLYSSDRGLELDEGEAVIAYVTSTGSPTSLDDPAIVLDILRKVV